MRFGAEFLGHTLKQNVHRGPVPIHFRIIAEHGDVIQGQPLHLEVPIAGANQGPAGQQHVARLRFLDLNGTGLVQPPGKHFREALGHMLDHQNGGREMSRQLGQKILQGLRASGRNPDGHDAGGPIVGLDLRGSRRAFLEQPRRHFAGLRGRLDFGNQLPGDLRHARRNIVRFGHEIKRSQGERLEGDRRAFGAV